MDKEEYYWKVAEAESKEEYQAKLPVLLGLKYIDLATTPHLLVSCPSNQVRDMFNQSLVHSLQCCGHPPYFSMHFISNDVRRANNQLAGIVAEMDSRYKELANAPKKQKEVLETMPYIIVVVDEIDDLIPRKGKLYNGPYAHIVRLIQIGRATRIHVVLETQRKLPCMVENFLRVAVETIVLNTIQVKAPGCAMLCQSY